MTQLSEFSREITRLYPALSSEMKPLAARLREQCKNYPHNPEGLQPLMLETIDKIKRSDRFRE